MGNHGHFMLLVLHANREDIMRALFSSAFLIFCGEKFLQWVIFFLNKKNNRVFLL
jgi:hypothetical protein